MSQTALIGLIVGLVILIVALAIVLLLASVSVGVKPALWDQTAAAQQWTEKADGAGDDYGLAAVQAVAGKWATSIGSLLGVLTAVAVVAGPSDLLNDVGGTEAQIAAGLVLVAAGLAAVATLLAALAEQGIPKYSGEFTGWVYKSLTEKRARKASDQLKTSRILTVIAFVLIIAATAVAWLTALTGNPPAKTQSAITTSSRGAVCGTLTTENGRLAVITGTTTTGLTGPTAVTLVDNCP